MGGDKKKKQNKNFYTKKMFEVFLFFFSINAKKWFQKRFI